MLRSLKNSKMGTFVEIRITEWEQLHGLAEAMPYYLFRGQSDSSWDLTTSLERSLYVNRAHKRDPLWMANVDEYWMVHEFKKRYHLYSSVIPAPTSSFEWLAIMQHHGSPTRLLDFTRSIYIAAYFALVETPSTSAIWAVSTFNLKQHIERVLKPGYDPDRVTRDIINDHHINTIDRYVCDTVQIDGCPNFAIYAEPSMYNQRLARQQGAFLVPTNIHRGFSENLFSSFGSEDQSDIDPIQVDIDYLRNKRAQHKRIDPLPPRNDIFVDIVKIVINESVRIDGLHDLMRMNISAETLFPDLDGLARSLVQNVILRH